MELMGSFMNDMGEPRLFSWCVWATNWAFRRDGDDRAGGGCRPYSGQTLRNRRELLNMITYALGVNASSMHVHRPAAPTKSRLHS